MMKGISSINKKLIMALSGAGLSLFLLIHMAGNASTFLGRQAFISYSSHLHALGPLIKLSEAGLLGLFLIHIVFGVSLFVENLQARPHGYAVKKSAGGRTWGSATMPYTGAITLLFLLIHLKNFHFSGLSVNIADLLLLNLENPLLAGYYLLSLLAITLHISHGFWSIFQTLGLSHPNFNGKIRCAALSTSLLTGLVFVLIPLCVLFSRQFLR